MGKARKGKTSNKSCGGDRAPSRLKDLLRRQEPMRTQLPNVTTEEVVIDSDIEIEDDQGYLSKLALEVICCLSTDKHIVKDCVIVKCGGRACKMCTLATQTRTMAKCSHCLTQHELNIDFEMGCTCIGTTINMLIQSNYTQLSELLTNRFKRKQSDITLNSEKTIDDTLEAVKNHIESMKRHLDSKFEQFESKITSYKSLVTSELSSINARVLNHKQANTSLQVLYDYQDQIITFERNIPGLFAMPLGMKFIPNNMFLDSFDHSWIGHIEYPFSANVQAESPSNQISSSSNVSCASDVQIPAVNKYKSLGFGIADENKTHRSTNEYKNELVVHSISCNTTFCTYFECIKMKTSIMHARTCQTDLCNVIPSCKQLKARVESFLEQNQSIAQLQEEIQGELPPNPVEMRDNEYELSQMTLNVPDPVDSSSHVDPKSQEQQESACIEQSLSNSMIVAEEIECATRWLTQQNVPASSSEEATNSKRPKPKRNIKKKICDDVFDTEIEVNDFSKFTEAETIGNIDCGDIGRLCISQKTKTAYISDYENSSIFTYNVDSSDTKTFKLNMDEPWAMAFDDTKNHLYIGDYALGKISVYTHNGPSLHRIKIIRSKHFNKIDSIELDCSYSMLYICDTMNNQIVEWSMNKKPEYMSKMLNDVNLPSTVRVKKDYLYVLCSTDVDVERKKQRQADGKSLEYIRKSIISTNNAICIYDRINWMLVKSISFDDWYNPRGLHVDNHLNIFTVAALKEQANGKISGLEYLFAIDTNDVSKTVTEMPFENVSDFCVSQKTFVFTFGSEKPPITILMF